jgi:signal transduction histidine kinase
MLNHNTKYDLSTFQLPRQRKDPAGVRQKIESLEITAITEYDRDIDILRSEIRALKKENQLLKERLAIMETLSGFVGHEIRQPLSALRVCLDVALGNAQIADAAKRQAAMDEIVFHGRHIVDQANSFIDMLLVKLRNMWTGAKKEKLARCSVSYDVKSALESYPFSEAERKRVAWNAKDAFDYIGDSELTKHMIYNLLKNALKIIAVERKGEITIRFEQSKKRNQLIFTDTARGIAKDFLSSIVDSFVTRSEDRKGTGLGLAFCKTVMQVYDGSIKCESEEGKYARFILSFPKIKGEKEDAGGA